MSCDEDVVKKGAWYDLSPRQYADALGSHLQRSFAGEKQWFDAVVLHLRQRHDLLGLS